MLTPGTLLRDDRTGTERYRLREPLHTGRSFELAIGEDTTRDNAPVVLKAIRWPDNGPDDLPESLRRARNECSALEADILRRNLPGLATGADLILLPLPDAPPEPIVVHDLIDGETLDRWLARTHPEGAPLDEGTRIARAIADILSSLHEADLVFRGLHPEHILRTPDGSLRLVGTGNIAQRAARVSDAKPWGMPRWNAPEIEGERSGQFVTPRADIWSFGLLLAWLFSNRRPTGLPDAPLTADAWERIRSHPEGLSLLIAHCLQPFHKKRFARLSHLLPLLHPDHLPTHQSDRFGEVWLLAPWKEAASREAARVGSLTPGPLVNRPRQDASPPNETAESDPGPQPGTPADTTAPSATPDHDSPAAWTSADAADDDETSAMDSEPEASTAAPDQTGLPAAPAPNAAGHEDLIPPESGRVRLFRLGFSAVIVVLAAIATALRFCA